ELNAQAVSFYKTAEVRTPDEVAPFEPGKILQQTEQKMMADPAGDIDLRIWICPYISRHLLSLNPLLACCRRYSRG
ncbi:hypothetical protein, partial [Escherichia coli]|uniref:hypothetical protein n=1 Tax=Escherichia coli TaxID=562 RepID=UPI0020749EAC